MVANGDTFWRPSCETFGKRKRVLPEYSMDDELDLNQLLFKKMEELQCDHLSPMEKARVEYKFLIEWLDRGGGNKSAAICTSNDKKNIFYSNFSISAKPAVKPISLLASLTSSDILGLMHERTGHLNKRALIECVKSKLVTGLQIDDSHIGRYRNLIKISVMCVQEQN